MSDAIPDRETFVSTEPAVLRAEERLAALRELREIGMALVRDLQRRVSAEAAVADAAPEEEASGERAPKARDPVDTFSRLSRAIRLTISLESKIDETLCGLMVCLWEAYDEQAVARAERARAAADQDPKDRLQTRHDRIDEVAALVRDVAENEMPYDQVEQLDRELEERFGWPQGRWADPDQPLRPMVEEICRYFRLSPDWSRWGTLWGENGDVEGWVIDPGPAPAAWPWETAGKRIDGAPAPAAPHALE